MNALNYWRPLSWPILKYETVISAELVVFWVLLDMLLKVKEKQLKL
jgi:hypothetical protein